MSPLRRSTRAARNADPSAGTPEPQATSPTPSPSKLDRKRKRGDEQVGSVSADGEAEGKPSHLTQASPESATAPAAHANGNNVARTTANVADTSLEDTKPSKNSLSEEWMELLGLPGSSTALKRASQSSVNVGFVDELKLTAEDVEKLSVVIVKICPSLLGNAHSKAKKGKERSATESGLPFATLQEALQPNTRLRDLRMHVSALRVTLLSDQTLLRHLKTSSGSSTSISPSLAIDSAKLSSLTLVLSLIDQLALAKRHADPATEMLKSQLTASFVEGRASALEQRQQKEKTVRTLKEKTDDLPAMLGRSFEGDDAMFKYALHMRLPRGDYFSKAIELGQDQLGELDPGQADVVKITPQSRSHLRALARSGLVTAPTMGQRMSRRKLPLKENDKHDPLQGTLKPVTFLNYGNYASFAPTHDSTGSSLSHTASHKLWLQRSQARLAESMVWGPQPFADTERFEIEDDSSDSIAAPKALAASRHSGDDLSSEMLDLTPDVDADAIKASLAQLDQDEEVTAHLKFNMMLLHQLQEFQWARLRHSLQASSERTNESELMPPSAEEEAAAALLLDSLSSLVALRPRTADLTSGNVDKVTPRASALQTFSASIGAIDPDLLGNADAGYWGTLDENVASASRGKVPKSSAPLSIRDNTTIRLTEESASKAKKAHRRGAMGSEDRGRGVLERFASSRTYNVKNDRHDVEVRTVERAASPHKTSAASVARHQSGEVASPGASSRPGIPSPGPQRYSAPSTQSHGQAQMAQPQNGMYSSQQTPQRGAGPNTSYAFSGSPAYGFPGRPMQSPLPVNPPFNSAKYLPQPSPQAGQYLASHGPSGHPPFPRPTGFPIPSNPSSPYPVQQKR